MPAEAVFAALLGSKHPGRCLGVVKLVLAPAVRLADRVRRGEVEVSPVDVPLVAEHALQLRPLVAAPLDDCPAHALADRLGIAIGAVQGPCRTRAPAAAAALRIARGELVQDQRATAPC